LCACVDLHYSEYSNSSKTISTQISLQIKCLMRFDMTSEHYKIMLVFRGQLVWGEWCDYPRQHNPRGGNMTGKINI